MGGVGLDSWEGRGGREGGVWVLAMGWDILRSPFFSLSPAS